jgi:predicted nuclease of predicted toxin-antitoxin system
MRFIADENIPLRVVDRLKEDIDIIHVTAIKAGLRDEEIIYLSNEERAVIITFDKDFGEIIFKHNKKPLGVIIL